MGFDRPFWIIAGLIIIPIACYALVKIKNPFVATIPLGAPGGIPFKEAQVGGFVKLLRTLEVLGIFLLFITAAGPAIKTPETVWLNRGADIIFILDTSPSMAALDMDGRSRFSAARTLLSDFAERRPSDNIGLTAVGTDAALLVPPTADRDAFNLRLESLRVGEFGEDTALGMGLAVAAYHLEKSNAKRKVAVLITDGENNAGAVHPETAAALLREMGVSLWIIGVGSAGEVPIDYIDPYTKVRRSGRFDSRFDIDSLRRLSITGGGTFIYAPSADSFAAAIAQLDDGEMTVQVSRTVSRSHSVAVYFLIPAILMLVMVKLSRRLLGALL
jgi:Ca-activated chloride channel family protein